MRNLTQALTLTSMATAVRSAFKIASVNPVLWWGAESHRAGLAGGAATLFQDSGGTSTVTAVEQPVGRAVDQSGNARHALQATSTARPVLTARVNLIPTSESAVGWASAGGTLSSEITGLRLKPTAPDPTYGSFFYRGPLFTGNGNYTFSFDVKSEGTRWVYANIQGGTPTGVWFDLQNVVVGQVNSGFFGKISNLGGGWYRCAVTHNRVGLIWPLIGIADVNGSSQIAKGAATGVSVNRLMLNEGVQQVPYQQSFTSSSYDTTAAPLMLQFDGVDDSLASATFAAGTLPADADVYLVMHRNANDGRFVVLHGQGTGAYVGAFETTTSTFGNAASGSPAIAINGTVISGSVTPPVGVSFLIEARGVNLGTWTSVNHGVYLAGWQTAGRIGCLLITPAQPDATRAKIRKALAKAYQIQGVV